MYTNTRNKISTINPIQPTIVTSFRDIEMIKKIKNFVPE